MKATLPYEKRFTERGLKHIHHLSVSIGGRGSCSQKERRASEYVASQLQALGASDVRIEAFQAIPSTYQPFALAFTATLTGALAIVFLEGRGALLLACALNILGVWAVLAEADLRTHWGRWLLPKTNSQNVVGVIPPEGPAKERVVLCAHVDSHRTPVFFSSERWYRAFSLLLGVVFFSMIVGAAAYGLGASLDWNWARWVGLALAPIQVFALVLCLQADFTPFSPGANDNASGVDAVLKLAECLMVEPLKHTEVHMTFNGCEEVGTYGMMDFLDRHANDLGPETFYIILDEVGLGDLIYLTADGLLIKYKTHPKALEIARQAAVSRPDLGVKEKVGIAYTDALTATKRGLISLTVCTLPSPGSAQVTHWHQMTDTLENVDEASLTRTRDFVWEILQIIDKNAG